MPFGFSSPVFYLNYIENIKSVCQESDYIFSVKKKKPPKNFVKKSFRPPKHIMWKVFFYPPSNWKKTPKKRDFFSSPKPYFSRPINRSELLLKINKKLLNLATFFTDCFGFLFCSPKRKGDGMMLHKILSIELLAPCSKKKKEKSEILIIRACLECKKRKKKTLFPMPVFEEKTLMELFFYIWF